MVPCVIKCESMCLAGQNSADCRVSEESSLKLHPWLAGSGTAGSGSTEPASRVSSSLPRPHPPQATELGWQSRPADCRDNWCFQAAGSLGGWGDHRSTSLPASGAGLGPPEPVWLVWRLLLPGLPGKGWRAGGERGRAGQGWGMGSSRGDGGLGLGMQRRRVGRRRGRRARALPGLTCDLACRFPHFPPLPHF